MMRIETFRRWRLVTTASLFALTVLTVMVATGWDPVLRVDVALSEAARGFGADHPSWVTAQRAITRAGDSLPLVLAGSALLVALLLLRRYAQAALVATAAAATHLVSAGLKVGLARPRPEDSFTVADGFAFTSGHTVHSATALVLLGYLLWPRLGRRARRVAVMVGALVALLVGVSRVALLAHWPTDVLGGWLVVLGVLPPVFIGAAARRRSSNAPRSSAGHRAMSGSPLPSRPARR